MQERSQAILEAIDNLIAEHDRWENDPTAPGVPTQAIDDAVEICIESTQGDIPGEHRHLISHLANFCEFWLEYRDGDWDKNGKPQPKVWTAFNQLRHARKTASARDVRRVETVTQLREQKVSDLLIAKAYGSRNEASGEWEGPFFHNGMVQNDLIERQYQHEKGNGEPVLAADWIPPVNQQITRDLSDKVTRKLAEIASRNTTQGPRDKGTPEELALGGAFPHQVKKAFGLSDAEVATLYQQIGKAEMLEPGQREKMLETPPVASQPEEPTADDDAIAALVVEIAAKDESLGAAEIAREVESQTGQKIDGRKVAGILRSQKQQAAA